MPTSTLKVISFNIGMGILNVRMERGWLRNPLLRRVRGIKPSLEHTFEQREWLRNVDILGLQEVCLADNGQIPYFAKVFRPRGINVNHHAGPERLGATNDCDKGQATLTRFPIRASGRLQLPRVGSHRATIWSDIEVAGLRGARGSLLRVYNIHLSNRDGSNLTPTEGRTRQVRVVLDHAHALEAECPGAPVVLLGDFNSISRLLRPSQQEESIRSVKQTFQSAIRRFQATMVLPYMADWIFYRHLRLASAGIEHVTYSDHYPVAAIFALD